MFRLHAKLGEEFVILSPVPTSSYLLIFFVFYRVVFFFSIGCTNFYFIVYKGFLMVLVMNLKLICVLNLDFIFAILIRKTTSELIECLILYVGWRKSSI